MQRFLFAYSDEFNPLEFGACLRIAHSLIICALEYLPFFKNYLEIWLAISITTRFFAFGLLCSSHLSYYFFACLIKNSMDVEVRKIIVIRSSS
jgi:hypothetical protein